MAEEGGGIQNDDVQLYFKLLLSTSNTQMCERLIAHSLFIKKKAQF